MVIVQNSETKCQEFETPLKLDGICEKKSPEYKVLGAPLKTISQKRKIFVADAHRPSKSKSTKTMLIPKIGAMVVVRASASLSVDLGFIP